MTGYLTMAQAAHRCPSRPHPSAIYRWARRGLKSRSGELVRLKHVRCGRGLYTTLEWLHKFFGDLAAADMPHFQDKDDDLDRAHADAEAKLDAAGL